MSGSEPREYQPGPNMPRHIAITMDGNNRWAKKRSLPGKEGHKAGEAVVQSVIEQAAYMGVEALTLFAFSSENWSRPQEEVDALMELFLKALSGKVGELHEKEIQLRFIGDLQAFSGDLLEGMQEAMDLTANNRRMVVSVAVNYGGRWDIVNASKQVLEAVQAGELEASAIDEDVFGKYTCLHDLPPVDLCIRTGGEIRISNFMLWQAAYSEFYFSDVLWPDFEAAHLREAVEEFGRRQRRFGGSG